MVVQFLGVEPRLAVPTHHHVVRSNRSDVVDAVALRPLSGGPSKPAGQCVGDGLLVFGAAAVARGLDVWGERAVAFPVGDEGEVVSKLVLGVLVGRDGSDESLLVGCLAHGWSRPAWGRKTAYGGQSSASAGCAHSAV